MENTNQRLKLELEGKEIEPQSEGETQPWRLCHVLNFEEDRKTFPVSLTLLEKNCIRWIQYFKKFIQKQGVKKFLFLLLIQHSLFVNFHNCICIMLLNLQRTVRSVKERHQAKEKMEKSQLTIWNMKWQTEMKDWRGLTTVEVWSISHALSQLLYDNWIQFFLSIHRYWNTDKHQFNKNNLPSEKSFSEWFGNDFVVIKLMRNQVNHMWALLRFPNNGYFWFFNALSIALVHENNEKILIAWRFVVLFKINESWN